MGMGSIAERFRGSEREYGMSGLRHDWGWAGSRSRVGVWGYG